ncbi:hypothetical protein NP118_23505 [Salmonella enterica]|nr:hypothetical protein [Salmonella enterica]
MKRKILGAWREQQWKLLSLEDCKNVKLLVKNLGRKMSLKKEGNGVKSEFKFGPLDLKIKKNKGWRLKET